MPITFNGTELPQSSLPEIQGEIFSDWGTFRDKDIAIEEGHKSGTEVYESRVAVIMSAYSTAAVSDGSDTLRFDRTPVTLTKIQFEGTVDDNALLDTRFEKSMKAGAFNMVSSEFDNAILQEISPAIAQTMESVTWDGATTATKAAIAALVAGAAQGSISAGAQTLVAAMPTNLVDSLPATILYNISQSKTTPGAGLGDYLKVPSIAASITATNIADEYAKMFAIVPDAITGSKVASDVPVIYAPLAHRKMMITANNSVGAASNKNFVFEGKGLQAKCYFQEIEVRFKPLVGFMICCPPKYLKVLMDLASDMSNLETGKMANGAAKRYYKNVQSFATWCTNQRYIVLYGG